METRKVHRVGSTSLAVTLPGRWVKSVGLGPGDEVTFLEEDQFTLLVTRERPGEDGSHAIRLDVPADAHPRWLERSVIGAYMVGYEAIEVLPEKPLHQDQLEGLRRSVARLTGFAVIESRPERILIRSYLDASRYDLKEHFNRLMGLVEAMLSKVSLVFGRRDLAAAREILALGDETDRIYYLTVRLLLASLSNRVMAAKMGLDSPQQAAGLRVIAKAIEEVGDRLEAVAEIAIRTEGIDWGLSSDITDKVAEFTEKMCGFLSGGLESFFSGSTQPADQMLEDIYAMEHKKEHLFEEVLQFVHTPTGAAIVSIAGMSLRDVCGLGRVICEVAVNNGLRRAGVVRNADPVPARPVTTSMLQTPTVAK